VADVAGQTKTAHFFDQLPHDKRRPRALITGDKAFKAFTASVALIVVLIIGLMAYYLYLGSRPSIERFGAGFIVGTEWDPVKGIFGALPLILGTLTTSAMALLIALPLSLGVALALSEYMPKRLSNVFSFLVELLAACTQRRLRALGPLRPNTFLARSRVPADQILSRLPPPLLWSDIWRRGLDG
jgi:hypothetical protein